MGTTAIPHTTGAVTSADGTTIGFHQYGHGRGVVLLSGGYLAAQHYTELAEALADTFTVYVPDRRGRGLSGPPGETYCMARECEDVHALLTGTGAHAVWGHSSGGLIALQAALTLPAIQKVAVFEPAVSMYGTFDLSWIPRFEREMDLGRLSAALTTFTKGVRASRGTDVMPRWLLVPMLGAYLRMERRRARPAGEATVESLVPLQRLDVRLFREMASSEGFAGLLADVSLMDGEKTPPPVRRALDALRRTLPDARRVTLRGVGHEAPLNRRGAPERVAAELRVFFSDRRA
jgi:pimeloyl-ACP methyl ester carboxylesterase